MFRPKKSWIFKISSIKSYFRWLHPGPNNVNQNTKVRKEDQNRVLESEGLKQERKFVINFWGTLKKLNETCEEKSLMKSQVFLALHPLKQLQKLNIMSAFENWPRMG